MILVSSEMKNIRNSMNYRHNLTLCIQKFSATTFSKFLFVYITVCFELANKTIAGTNLSITIEKIKEFCGFLSRFLVCPHSNLETGLYSTTLITSQNMDGAIFNRRSFWPFFLYYSKGSSINHVAKIWCF